MPLHKSNNKKKLSKNYQNQLFQNSRINKWFAAIQEIFNEEKTLNLSKKLIFVLTCTSPIFQPSSSLEKSQLTFPVPVGAEQTSSSKNYYLTCLVVPWKTPLKMLAFIWPHLNLSGAKRLYLGNICQMSNIADAWGNG